MNTEAVRIHVRNNLPGCPYIQYIAAFKAMREIAEQNGFMSEEEAEHSHPAMTQELCRNTRNMLIK